MGLNKNEVLQTGEVLTQEVNHSDKAHLKVWTVGLFNTGDVKAHAGPTVVIFKIQNHLFFLHLHTDLFHKDHTSIFPNEYAFHTNVP